MFVADYNWLKINCLCLRGMILRTLISKNLKTARLVQNYNIKYIDCFKISLKESKTILAALL